MVMRGTAAFVIAGMVALPCCTNSIDYTLRVGFPADVTAATFEGSAITDGYTYMRQFDDETQTSAWRGVSLSFLRDGSRYDAVIDRLACEPQGLISEEVYWRFDWYPVDGFSYGPESGRCHSDHGTYEFASRLALDATDVQYPATSAGVVSPAP